MSNASVADVKQAQPEELHSKKGEALATSRGKLVDDMFVSATTYLESYARRTGDDRPWMTWIGYQEAWRNNVALSVAFARNMTSVYLRYDTIFKEIKDVSTKQEMDYAITLLQDSLRAMPPDIPSDLSQRFLVTSRDVSYFESAFNFPELNRHYAFIRESLLQFAEAWAKLHSESVQLYEMLLAAIDSATIMGFRAYIKLVIEFILSPSAGLESVVADLNLEG